ncbi:MAG: prolyl oligopeptidase family serine peptidase [Luteitalea sp.]|nr:prolyl oligopeptidase family serine peptidase [Luteitalea sp.]
MRHAYWTARLFILTIGFAAGAADERGAARSEDTPPVAKRIPKVRDLHGDRFVDDYFWLREKSDPEVLKYLEAENAYTDTVMKPLEGVRETLYAEMVARIKETDLSVPYREGDYWYYTRTEQGKQYPILCRKQGSVDGGEEIYLDVNELAVGEKFMALGAVAVSDDGNLVAYATDNTGFRDYRLHVKDLRTGQVIESPVEKIVTIAWAADNQTLFYTIPDAAKRPYRLYRRTIGQQGDSLLYEEEDERFRVHVSRSRSKDYLFLEVESHTASEVRYLRTDEPTAAWQLIAAREDDHEYDVDHRGDLFYIRTNQAGRNFGLMTAPRDRPDRTNWIELIPHRADVMLESVILFRDHLVLAEREHGLPVIRVQRFGSTAWQGVPFPEPVYTAVPAPGPEFNATELRYHYQSFVTPSSVFEYDMETRETRLLKEDEVLGGYERTKYATERIYATAADGAKVPVSLVYLKTLKRDGSAPLFLTAYGSYGFPSNVRFSSNRFSLVDRGVVYALAHIRGGGDLGKPWHDAGRMMNKKNTFTDFIASAEHLLAKKYGAKDRLVIEGGSAGGLLMGAVTNMRPDLFKAVVAHVPFVDVINTMSDPSLPLTVAEFEEWGNPAKKAEYEYIRSYCPYTNLARKAYPAMLVKTSLDDSQVMYWEPAKYVARMRALKTDENPLIFKTNMSAGHGGASGRYDRLREIAFDYAFMLWQMKVSGLGRARSPNAP